MAAPDKQKRNTAVKRNLVVNTRESEGNPWQMLGHGAALFAKSLVLYCFLAGMFLLWQEGADYVRAEGWLNIDNLEVSGNKKVGSDEIWHFAGINTGAYIFDVDLNSAAEGIRKHPWVKDVRLMRRLPGTIRAVVTENQVAAILALDPPVFVDADGEPFKVADSQADEVYPLISGVSRNDYDNTELGKRKVKVALMLVNEYKKHPVNTVAPLKGISFVPGGFELLVGGVPTRVVLGKTPFVEKFDRLAKLWKHIYRSGREAALIHLDNEDMPERVTASMVKDEEPQDGTIRN